MSDRQTPSLLPEIVAELRDGDSVTLQIRIDAGLAFFAGHFPGTPVLPGVVQIHWAVQLARSRLPVLGSFHHMEVVKFKDLITPSRTLDLQLEYDGEAGRLKFAYRSAKHDFSSGRIYFHGN